MENSFYVGTVHYGKRVLTGEHSERLVLYSDDGVRYLELTSGNYYTTDSSNRDYVEKGSLIVTDIKQYREDYMYLLFKFKEDKPTKRKKFLK